MMLIPFSTKDSLQWFWPICAPLDFPILSLGGDHEETASCLGRRLNFSIIIRLVQKC